MKRFSKKQDVVITTEHYPLISNAEKGDVIHHNTSVDCVYFYKRQFIQEQEVFIKIELSKQMILDIADEIKDIEKEIIEKPYNGIDF